MKTLVSSTTLSLAGLAVFMDQAVNILRLDAELLGLLGAITGEPIAFGQHCLNAHRIPSLLSLGLPNQPLNRLFFVTFPLVAVAHINPYHFAEKLTLGPALLPGESLDLFNHRGRDGKA